MSEHKPDYAYSLLLENNYSKKITYVLLRKRVNKLWEDLIGDNSLSKLIRIVGQSTEGECGGLLDAWHVVKE